MGSTCSDEKHLHSRTNFVATTKLIFRQSLEECSFISTASTYIANGNCTTLPNTFHLNGSQAAFTPLCGTHTNSNDLLHELVQLG